MIHLYLQCKNRKIAKFGLTRYCTHADVIIFIVNKKVNLKNVKMWATNFRVNTQTFSAYILKLTGFHMENFFPVQSHIFHN